MATDTTGSTVYSLKAGLRQHLGGGTNVIYGIGNPSGIVFAAPPGAAPSGGVVFYDQTNDKFFRYIGAGKWNELGSVQYT